VVVYQPAQGLIWAIVHILLRTGTFVSRDSSARVRSVDKKSFGITWAAGARSTYVAIDKNPRVLILQLQSGEGAGDHQVEQSCREGLVLLRRRDG